ncbi:GNAT family N-acetyltransferase [Halobacillus locisalis]|uniref:GNAT family N-acetyltransferase n=2 Tax=Halobacillus locisalis TaxID=220753 RepID=A0A838CP65_9BACI|nr:GNAT family N-acetyltransferase [Halobacillus locisalis]
MNEAREIVQWRYEPPYDLYNNDDKEETIYEFTNGSYVALYNEQEHLFGFYCTGASAQVPAGHKQGVYKEALLDIGLGMNPDDVGCGNGRDFCEVVLSIIIHTHGKTPIRLSVATFNARAIRVYEKLGFVRLDYFHTDVTEFITMVKR